MKLVSVVELDDLRLIWWHVMNFSLNITQMAFILYFSAKYVDNKLRAGNKVIIMIGILFGPTLYHSSSSILFNLNLRLIFYCNQNKSISQRDEVCKRS